MKAKSCDLILFELSLPYVKGSRKGLSWDTDINLIELYRVSCMETVSKAGEW